VDAKERELIITEFKKGTFKVLVTTDILRAALELVRKYP